MYKKRRLKVNCKRGNVLVYICEGESLSGGIYLLAILSEGIIQKTQSQDADQDIYKGSKFINTYTPPKVQKMSAH